jgi:hypothetical protein
MEVNNLKSGDAMMAKPLPVAHPKNKDFLMAGKAVSNKPGGVHKSHKMNKLRES